MTEIAYDEHTMLVGTLFEQDDSFDHELGIERVFDTDVKDFHVVCYIGGMDYDVTSSFTDKQLQYFKEWFIDKARR